MNCPDHQTISAFVDGELEDLHATEIQQHVVTCPSCRHLVEELQSLDSCGRSALRAIPTEEPIGSRIVRLEVPARKRLRPVLLAAAAVLVAALVVWSLLVGHTGPGRPQAGNQATP